MPDLRLLAALNITLLLLLVLPAGALSTVDPPAVESARALPDSAVAPPARKPSVAGETCVVPAAAGGTEPAIRPVNLPTPRQLQPGASMAAPEPRPLPPPVSSAVIEGEKPALLPPAKQSLETDGAAGRIELMELYALPQGAAEPIASGKVELATEELRVHFAYRNLAAGDVLTGVWTDIGRQSLLCAVPILVAAAEGEGDFSLRRPVAGWARGNYRVDIKVADKTLKSVHFNIEE